MKMLVQPALSFSVPSSAAQLSMVRQEVVPTQMTRPPFFRVSLMVWATSAEIMQYSEDISEHEMHSEYCMISADVARTINETRKNGGRVICVGTTSCRTIESFAAEDGTLKESAGWTNIFIYPGYRFKVLDGLITNFHLPESTLIMLVSALAGREHVLAAYEEAVRERYRFFSFGDAMIIL